MVSECLALKSWPQALDMVKVPESFRPVKVYTRQMLADASQYSLHMRGVRGQMAAKRAMEVACTGSQHSAGRAAGPRKNDAGEAHPDDSPSDVTQDSQPRRHRSSENARRRVPFPLNYALHLRPRWENVLKQAVSEPHQTSNLRKLLAILVDRLNPQD